jgi:serine phosphatase RsbU (regulator of sigma subunit)
LNPADLIVAYTDRVVEVGNTAGEEWGVRGLLAAVAACQMRQPDRIVQAAFTALDFSGDSQTDDATILAAIVN